MWHRCLELQLLKSEEKPFTSPLSFVSANFTKPTTDKLAQGKTVSNCLATVIKWGEEAMTDKKTKRSSRKYDSEKWQKEALVLILVCYSCTVCRLHNR